jgi:hypothetical protein
VPACQITDSLRTNPRALLRRLRLTGLIQRLPHTNRSTLPPDCIRIAVFYLHNRLLIPLTAADRPQPPPELRQALHTLDQHVDDYIHPAPGPRQGEKSSGWSGFGRIIGA